MTIIGSDQITREPRIDLISRPFTKALKEVRCALRSAGLSIAAEIKMSDREAKRVYPGAQAGCVLLVDSPFLLLESVTLDRAAAIFVPYHLIVCGNSHSSYVHWPQPVCLDSIRLPSTAVRAITLLETRVKWAMNGALSPRS